MNRNYCFTSAIVFTFVALLHAWRFVLDLPLQIGAWYVPAYLSGFAAIGAALLAGWALWSAKSAKPAGEAYT